MEPIIAEAQVAFQEIVNDIIIPFSFYIGDDIPCVILFVLMFASVLYSVDVVYIFFCVAVYRSSYVLSKTPVWPEHRNPLMTLVVCLLVTNIIWLVTRSPWAR